MDVCLAALKQPYAVDAAGQAGDPDCLPGHLSLRFPTTYRALMLMPV